MPDIFNKGIGGHHRAFRGRTDEWLTPPFILKALGEFDLDPCSPVNRPWPTAKNHYTVEDNGLSKQWEGRVFMNPPYGPELIEWMRRLSNHGNGIALIFARTETKAFFQHVWPKAHAILFLEGRLSFYNVKGNVSKTNSGGPSVLIAYGQENADILEQCGLKGRFITLKCDPPETVDPFWQDFLDKIAKHNREMKELNKPRTGFLGWLQRWMPTDSGVW